MPRAQILRSLSLSALVALGGAVFAACAGGDPVGATQNIGEGDKDPASSGGHDEEAICLLHNCNSDDECGACSDGRNTCLVAEPGQKERVC